MEAKLSDAVVAKLKSKASTVRSRLAERAKYDAECVMTDSHHYEKEMIIRTNFSKFLSGFLSRSTIDLPSAQPYATSSKTLSREARKHEYVFLDKLADPAALQLDANWIKAQDNYIIKLRKAQLFDLYGYTYNGDVFINNYIRGSFDPAQFQDYLDKFDIAKPDYFALFFPAVRILNKFSHSHDMLKLFFKTSPTDEDFNEILAIIGASSDKMRYMKLVSIAPKLSYDRFWILVLEDYRDSIEDIIRKAPPTTKPMVLYRGVESDYFLTKFMKDNTTRIHIANSFVSTTSSISVANDFASYENKCCFIRLYIPKGTRMLMMMGVSRFLHEVEFLLSHKTQFYIQKVRMEKFCSGSYNLEMRTSSLVVI